MRFWEVFTRNLLITIRMVVGPKIIVESPNVKYSQDYIESLYDYQRTTVEIVDKQLVVSWFLIITFLEQ